MIEHRIEHSYVVKQNFVSRFITPIVLLLGIYIVLHNLYFESWKIDNRDVQYGISFIAGIVLFVFIGFNSLIVYPVLYFKGATIHERIIASLIVQIVWIIKELVRVSEFFTFGETLYYTLNSAFLLALSGSFAFMGISEMFCRYRLKKKGVGLQKIITPLPVMSVISGIIALYIFLIWGVGEHWFYIYVTGYKLIFH